MRLPCFRGGSNRQPLDRAARLLLLFANMSKFGPGEFKQQIEEIKFMNDLSGNERYIVQQIFLVGFRHAAQEGQTTSKNCLSMSPQAAHVGASARCGD